MLNPAVVFVTAVWGQWDSVSLAILLVGVYLIVRSEWTWIIASPFLVWAVLIKPQLAVAGLLFISLIFYAFYTRGDLTERRLRQFVTAAIFSVILGLAIAYAILAPFSVRLLPLGTGGSTLQERLQEALELYPETTLGAANIWMIPLGSLERVSDQEPRLLGMAPQQWGTIGLLLLLAYVGVMTITKFSTSKRIEAISWAATAATYIIFMIPTRVHERYLFPILVFALLLVALRGFDRRLACLYWSISIVFLINLLLVYGGFRSGFTSEAAETFDRVAFTATSIANIALLGAVLTIPWWMKDGRI